ncbi:MAG: hypothetical protein NC411_02150 [Bacteroides sp.]|nr:hypothetical protein [Bacteroides sp.]
MNNIDKYIESLYDSAASLEKHDSLDVSETAKIYIDTIINASENSKGVLAVTVTSLIYKSLYPEQDIRCHQTSIPNGYSGRVFDSLHITPFLRSKSFPNMAESGWLTRSLEQKRPYNFDYPGAIQPVALKKVFLSLLDEVETKGLNPMDSTIYLFHKLILQRDSKKIELAKPKNLSIESIIDVLTKHFNYNYKSRGASRLPVLAFYAIYQIILSEFKRFNEKTLLPLENHNSADSQSGRLGDIDVIDAEGNPFEAVEVKFDIPISIDILNRAKEKILPSPVSRYYILSTKEINNEDRIGIEDIIKQVKNSHGCQIIVNGVIPSLKYYLRLLENPTLFVLRYVALLNSDDTIKFEHKIRWNKIIEQL